MLCNGAAPRVEPLPAGLLNTGSGGIAGGFIPPKVPPILKVTPHKGQFEMDNSADSKILKATNGDSAPTRVIAMVIGGQVRSAEKLSDGHIAFHVEDLRGDSLILIPQTDRYRPQNRGDADLKQDRVIC